MSIDEQMKNTGALQQQVSSLPSGKNNYAQVNVNSFGAKYRSKREVYRFISFECKIFVPSLETVTNAHLSDLMSGKKMTVELEQVKPINVPYYKGLTLVEILTWGCQFKPVVDALPIERECLKLDRKYVCDLIHTIVGEPFARWVDERVQERNRRIAVEGNQIINMDPKMAEIFMKSTQVSTTNGRSCHLLKVGSKRRRTKAQVEADKLSEKVSMREMKEALAKLQDVTNAQEKERLEHAQQLSKMQQTLKLNENLEKQLELAKIKAEEGQKSKKVIEGLLAEGTLKRNEQGHLVSIDPNTGQSRRQSFI